MNLVADEVSTTVTSAPSARSARAREAALEGAVPPQTPSNTRRPARAATSVDLDDLLGALVGDLALGDLLEGDRQRLVAQTGLDERRHELAAAFAELAVVRVDLSRALRGHDHERVLRVDGGEQIVDLGFDHEKGTPVDGNPLVSGCGTPR